MTAHRIVVRRYGPAALHTVPLIRRAALDATRDVVRGDKILMLSVGASSFVAGPLRLATELTTRPSARQRAHILGAADQITAALLAMALHELGVPAVSLTGEQTGLTPRSVTEGARSGQLNCDRVRAAIEQHPAVVLASVCAPPVTETSARLTTRSSGWPRSRSAGRWTPATPSPIPAPTVPTRIGSKGRSHEHSHISSHTHGGSRDRRRPGWLDRSRAPGPRRDRCRAAGAREVPPLPHRRITAGLLPACAGAERGQAEGRRGRLYRQARRPVPLGVRRRLGSQLDGGLRRGAALLASRQGHVRQDPA